MKPRFSGSVDGYFDDPPWQGSATAESGPLLQDYDAWEIVRVLPV